MNAKNSNRARLFFIASTRALLGAGIGLLTAARMRARKRRRIGLTLLTIGAVTTVPAAYFLFRLAEPAEDRASLPA
jgi:hypothetical protein